MGNFRNNLNEFWGLWDIWNFRNNLNEFWGLWDIWNFRNNLNEFWGLWDICNFRNNLNEFWDFDHGTNLGACSTQPTLLVLVKSKAIIMCCDPTNLQPTCSTTPSFVQNNNKNLFSKAHKSQRSQKRERERETYPLIITSRRIFSSYNTKNQTAIVKPSPNPISLF